MNVPGTIDKLKIPRVIGEFLGTKIFTIEAREVVIRNTCLLQFLDKTLASC